jgi:hypothetical protein
MTETIMTNKTWLAASCAIVLLAAGPAFAQTQTPGNGTGSGAVNNSSNAAATGNAAGMPSDAAATKGGSGPQATNNSMNGSDQQQHWDRHVTRNGGNATSQDAAVDQLNERSYEAAQQGKSFDVNGSGGSGGGPTGTSGGPGSAASPNGNRM